MSNMKQFLALLTASILGGAIAFVGFTQLSPQESALEQASPRAILTSHSINTSPSTFTQPFNFVKAAEKTTPAVVHITANESKALAQSNKRDRNDPFGMFDFGDLFGQQFFGPKNGTGSGVIISEDGYIVTNNHVVGFADDITVSLSDKREFVATKIGTDPSTDLALLKIQATDLTAVEFSNSDNVKVGEWVAAVGNPFSYLTSTVTAGIVSAKGRDIDIIQGEKTIEEFIQTDAAVNPGNSGGALVNSDGELIGINTAIATPTGVFAGYSFAIPSNLVAKVIKEIKENGDIKRARLGVLGDSVDEKIIEERKLSVTEGFYIAKIEPGSAAQLAGILPGDVITSANGTPVSNYEDLVEVMEFAKVGDVIKLKLQRKNKIKDISVKLRKGL